MLNPQLLEYIKHQLEFNQPIDFIKSNLTLAGWKQEDIEQAIKEITSLPKTNSVETVQSEIFQIVPKPKTINLLSNLVFLLALINIPAAFAGSISILVTNQAMMKGNPGGLEYSMIKAIPFIGLISLPGIISLPLLLLAAIKIRSGSPKAWKSGLIILIAILLTNLLTGFLTAALMSPIYSATSLN